MIGDGFNTAQSLLATTTPTGIAMYALLIILFTFFYTFVQINPEKAAENLQKSGAYIPGVRPGKGTEQFMSKLLRRLATVGSLFLGFISIIPIIAKDLFWFIRYSRFGRYQSFDHHCHWYRRNETIGRIFTEEKIYRLYEYNNKIEIG